MSKIFIVGEAYGEAEERQQTPFVGASGFELTRMLSEAGIERSQCDLSNVFNLRPKGNRVETLCGPKSEGIEGYPALVKGKYVSEDYQRELDRLGHEIVDANPNLVIALGNTPLWALCGVSGISKLRGTTRISTYTALDFKVLPTYHPAAVLRQWELRPIVIFDLIKAKKESEYAEIRRPKRFIWIEPSLDDIRDFIQRYINPDARVAVDIETAGNQITCIGFSPRSDIALVIPFHDYGRKGGSYWPTAADEREAWAIIRGVLEDRTIRKTFQNGLYDIPFIYRTTGIKTYGAADDTMLLHHALQPESLKSLGFLGSVYTDEGSWKNMRKTETIKRDE